MIALFCYHLGLVNIFTKIKGVTNPYVIIFAGDRMQYMEFSKDKKYIERIRGLREDHDFTQQYVARYLNTSQTMYARYERGASALPIHHLIYLTELYNVSSDYILGITNNPVPYEEYFREAAVTDQDPRSPGKYNIHWKGNS